MRKDIVYLTEAEANVDIGTLHVPQAITNMSVGYKNDQMIAEEIAPVVPATKLSDVYYVFGKEKFRSYDDNYIPGVTPGEIGWSLATAPYTLSGHAVRGWYPSMAPSLADEVVDLDPETTINVSDAIQLREELNLKTALVAALSPTSMLAAGVNFDNPAFDPIPWFDEQKEVIARQIGIEPNSVAMGRPAWRGLRNNQNFLKHIATGNLSFNVLPGSQISIAQAAEKLELENFVVGKGMYDTAPLGETANLQYIWDQYVLIYYKPPAPGRRTVALAYTFLFTGGVQGQMLTKWFDQDKYRQVIDGRKFYGQQVIAAGAGLMFSNALSAASVPVGEV
jgi:hypothetical protein